MRNFIKTTACMTAGAITGALFGAACVPLGWVVDATAPVSYPLISAVQVYTVTENRKAALLGSLIGVAQVPIAPISALSRPVGLPLVCAGIGSAIGFKTANK